MSLYDDGEYVPEEEADRADFLFDTMKDTQAENSNQSQDKTESERGVQLVVSQTLESSHPDKTPSSAWNGEGANAQKQEKKE